MMKHADLIRAALDGKVIQHRLETGWVNLSDEGLLRHMATRQNLPLNEQYRIKPEPVPDVVVWTYALSSCYGVLQEDQARRLAKAYSGDVIKLTINGETGEKTVEIVE